MILTSDIPCNADVAKTGGEIRAKRERSSKLIHVDFKATNIVDVRACFRICRRHSRLLWKSAADDHVNTARKCTRGG